MKKWEKKLWDGIQSVISENKCVFKFYDDSKTIDVGLTDGTVYRYQIYRHRNKWSVCEMRSDNGFGFRVISDWDGFRTLEEAVEAILEDIQIKAALHDDKIAEEQRVFGTETQKNIAEAVIEDETGQEISIEYMIQKVIYTHKKVQHIGIIVDVEYHDNIHNEAENEEIRQKYVGREFQIDTDGYWEIV